ncbi:MAG: PEP-utilizing enzyme, partial [Nitrososphaerales archaeon]
MTTSVANNCRQLEKPAIVGAKGVVATLKNGDTITINSVTGEIAIQSILGTNS